jgi:hypothetical protein
VSVLPDSNTRIVYVPQGLDRTIRIAA